MGDCSVDNFINLIITHKDSIISSAQKTKLCSSSTYNSQKTKKQSRIRDSSPQGNDLLRKKLSHDTQVTSFMSFNI